jgi:pimeloyl-ACP methyl ester carboxylesterase
VKADTLVLGGTADQYFDVEAFTETARLIPSAQLKLFEGETHMLPIERRGEVAQVLKAFLAPVAA